MGLEKIVFEDHEAFFSIFLTFTAQTIIIKKIISILNVHIHETFLGTSSLWKFYVKCWHLTSCSVWKRLGRKKKRKKFPEKTQNSRLWEWAEFDWCFLPLYMNMRVSHRHIHRRGSFTTRRERRPVRCPSDRGMSSIIPPSQVESSECGPPSRSLQTHRDCGRSLSNRRWNQHKIPLSYTNEEFVKTDWGPAG